MVYLCYLKEEEEKKELPKPTNIEKVKSDETADVDSNQSELDDSDRIFDRAKSEETDTR